MTQLIRYDAARKALSEAVSVDEVKDLRDKAEAMRAYGRQAKDYEMANWAAEIRIRAERRLGQMLAEQKEAGLMNTGAKGIGKKVQSDSSTALPTLKQIGISKDLSSRSQAFAAVPEQEFEQAISEHREQQKELTSETINRLTEKGKAHVSHNSGDNEWYTPKEIIDAAHGVMGDIDLDPASSEIANKTVRAERFFTKADNGLEKEWRGRIWMNPPYAQPLIKHFCEKLIIEIDSFRVEEAIVLVNNATDTSWFQGIARRSSALCFTDKRIRFLDPNGNPGAPLQGQAILYFGENIGMVGNGGFVDMFNDIGFCVRHV